jgi:hypothetical protein
MQKRASICWQVRTVASARGGPRPAAKIARPHEPARTTTEAIRARATNTGASRGSTAAVNVSGALGDEPSRMCSWSAMTANPEPGAAARTCGGCAVGVSDHGRPHSAAMATTENVTISATTDSSRVLGRASLYLTMFPTVAAHGSPIGQPARRRRVVIALRSLSFPALMWQSTTLCPRASALTTGTDPEWA